MCLGLFVFFWQLEDILMAKKPSYEELEQRVKELENEGVKRKRSAKQLERVNYLKEELLSSQSLDEKLRLITDRVVEIFHAEFCRIWITKQGDLCDSGCFHAKVTEGPHICRYREHCLHLMASSGRYTHIDGGHRRVPFGCYKIGRVASGEDPKFVTNDVTSDPRVHDHEWARKLGLVSFAGYRLLSSDGTPIGVFALFSKYTITLNDDVLLHGLANTTAQVIQTAMADSALRESRKRYMELWENAPVAYHLLDSEGIVRQVNQTEIDMLGYAREEMVGKPVFEFILPEQRKDAEERFRLKLAGETVPKQDDRVYVKKDGSKIYVAIDDVVEHDSDGKILGVRTTMVDISNQKLAEEALKESSEKIKLFAYSISHDLKSPAIGIYGLAKRLRKYFSDVLDQKATAYSDQILKAAEQIAELVEQINVFISTKETPFSMEPVELRGILQTVRDEFSTQLNVRQIRWLEPENVPEIKMDRLSILRSMRNLVDNALKHGGDHLGEIRFGYEGSDEFHIISVSNDGAGIEIQDPEEIFGLFRRDETSKGIEGAGLGLTIVKEVAEQHGGKVWVESDPEKGPTFYISISRHL
jgi:PAS domain S-box-containing protein